MSACNDIDALMIDWLYDELDEVKSAEFAQHLDGCARCRMEVESLQQTRAAVRDWPEVDPPSALSAILLHEAAKHAPAKKRAVAIASADDKPGLWAWLVGMMAPVVRHPAAAALATLVLVAGVAGSLYLREVKIAQPLVKSEAPSPAHAEISSAPAAAATADRKELGLELDRRSGEIDPADSYAVQLADEGDIERLSRELVQDPFADSNRDQQVVTKAPRSRNKLGKRKNAPKADPASEWGGSLANAVSGADELVDLEEANQPAGDKPRDLSAEVMGGTNVAVDDKRRAEQQKSSPAANSPVTVTTTSKAGKKKDYAEPPPPAPAQGEATAQYRPYDAKKELKWAQTEERKLDDALRGQRCRDAARIANDILDRNPDYYYTRVERSKAIKSCEWYVKDERQKRSRRRSKARPKRAAPNSPMEADSVE